MIKKTFIFFRRILFSKIIIIFALIMSFLIFAFWRSLPPASFPIGEIVSITPGDGVRDIAFELEKKGYVRSAEWFMLLLKLRSSSGFVISGDYIFDKPAPVFVMVDRLSSGDYGPTQIDITIPEGSNTEKIIEIVGDVLEDFNLTEMAALMKGKEGYLFPDTYQVFPSVTPKELVGLLEENFLAKVNPLFEEHDITEEEVSDIVTLASIVEREAFADNYEEHQIVAGIMKRRIEIGMPLQVDATLHYLLGKTSKQLTKSDLKTDSPYNSYTNKGLPPGPISNPGLLAIRSVIESKPSEYLFYLHGSDGRIHYAVTHDEHVANKRRYLR